MVANAPIDPPLTEFERALSARLHEHVQTLAGLIGPRHMGRPTSMEAAAAYIERQCRQVGDDVERQSYPVAGSEAVNLVVERRGVRRPDEIVIVGAHYDTLPQTPGADDNASAVAMLIEVSRLLQDRTPGRTVRFVAFANEEPPHFYSDTMGSQVYARRCRARRERIVGLICLEMVGYYRTDAHTQDYPPAIRRPARLLLPNRGDFLAAASNLPSAGLLMSFRRGFKRAVRFPLIAVPLPEAVNEIRRSDNGPFWDEGFRAIMVTDTSFLRNPNYHQPTDTPDTLDYDRMARATLGVAGGVAHVAR